MEKSSEVPVKVATRYRAILQVCGISQASVGFIHGNLVVDAPFWGLNAMARHLSANTGGEVELSRLTVHVTACTVALCYLFEPMPLPSSQNNHIDSTPVNTQGLGQKQIPGIGKSRIVKTCLLTFFKYRLRPNGPFAR